MPNKELSRAHSYKKINQSIKLFYGKLMFISFVKEISFLYPYLNISIPSPSLLIYNLILKKSKIKFVRKIITKINENIVFRQ